MSQNTSKNKGIEALDLMIESLYKVDPELRTEANSLGCLSELLNIRENILDELNSLRKEMDEMTESDVL